MRVYTLAFALILTVGGSSASAQTGVSFGVKAGANFANLDFSGDDVDVSFDRRVGLVAGAFMLVPMTDTFGFQVEGLYSQKGAKFEEDGFEGSLKLDSFDVPVLARYTIPSSTDTSFHLFAGPSLGFKLSAKSKTSFDGEDDEEDISDDVAGVDFGVVIGAGLEFGRFVVDGRYTHGLTNLNKAEDNDGVETKSRVFSIMAGFRF